MVVAVEEADFTAVGAEVWAFTAAVVAGSATVVAEAIEEADRPEVRGRSAEDVLTRAEAIGADLLVAARLTVDRCRAITERVTEPAEVSPADRVA
jgi:hypothetical protein